MTPGRGTSPPSEPVNHEAGQQATPRESPIVSGALARSFSRDPQLRKSDRLTRVSPMGGGSRPKLVHRPELVTRSDGRYEVRCSDCRGRSDEPVPIGIGLPVSSKVLALEMLRNHVGPAAWRTASQILPEPPRAVTKHGADTAPPLGAPKRGADVRRTVNPASRTA